MTILWPKIALLWLLSLCCNGCGAPAERHSRPAPPPSEDEFSPTIADYLPANSYCATIVDFFCDFYMRCGRMAAADHEACRDLFMESCTQRYQPVYVAIETAGLLRLSNAGTHACAEHLEHVACDAQPMDLGGACAYMWAGTQPEGAPCGFDIESFVCAPGTRCVLGLSLCGTCQPVAGMNESCDNDVVCPVEAACIGNICKPRALPHEECGAEQPCILGSYCAANTCQPRLFSELDAPCDAALRCPYGSRCVEGTCRKTALLQQACTDNLPCETGHCEAGTCSPLLAAQAQCSAGTQCVSGRCITEQCDAIPSGCF